MDQCILLEEIGLEFSLLAGREVPSRARLSTIVPRGEHLLEMALAIGLAAIFNFDLAFIDTHLVFQIIVG